MTSSSKVVVEWSFRKNGAEVTFTALVKLDLCHLKRVLKSYIGRNEL